MRRSLALVAALVALAACSRGRAESRTAATASVQVAAIDIGRAVGLDKRVAEPARSFAPGDTIYASVATEGKAPLVSLTARWRHAGATFHEETQMIAPDGAAQSEFHVSKPDGWSAGSYEVEILVDGIPSGRRDFSVD
jgi:hypothetical protein